MILFIVTYDLVINGVIPVTIIAENALHITSQLVDEIFKRY